MDLFLQLLANGLVIGTFYALSALGLTLVFGLMRVVNFAHGELYVVGGLLGWALTDLVGLNFFLTLALVIVSLAVGGYLIDRLLMGRVRGQGEEPTILLTIGLSIFITNTALQTSRCSLALSSSRSRGWCWWPSPLPSSSPPIC